tara:strand:+ start:541 stop:819 length:279 start_codon:yes stop_codon:yes gene_type:complete
MNKLNKINHIEIMDNILTDAKNKGWEVLKRWTAGNGWGEDTEYVVLMKKVERDRKNKNPGLNDELVLAHYLPFNQGLMKSQKGGGSGIWEAV